MAPSVQELPVDIQPVFQEKLQAVTQEAPKEQPKVKRQIEIEGGTTNAKVHLLTLFIQEQSNTNRTSTPTISLPGITARNIHRSSLSPIQTPAFLPHPPSQISSPQDPKSKN